MITGEVFGHTAAGEAVTRFTLTNRNGAFVRILDYGCTLQAICVPDRSGALTDVCLGYETLAEYEQNDGYLGAVIGRYGNRIANARFCLNGKEYHLAPNEAPNHLHGGNKGFDKYVWASEINDDCLRFTRVSPDGEEGYPSTLHLCVEYRWNDAQALSITYFAKAEGDTVLNLTNHTYFNLNGQGSGTILGHQLQLHAEHFTEIDARMLPTGRLCAVEGTPFDFRSGKRIGDGMDMNNEQLRYGNGYDHNFAFAPAQGVREIGRLTGERSGITMAIETDQPGVQLYCSNVLTERHGKDGAVYHKHQALCLETQHFPNSTEQPNFPSVVLRKDETFQTETVYRFSAR